MSTITHPAVRQAMEELQHLSEDDEARRLAFVRERASRDEVSLMNSARNVRLKEAAPQYVVDEALARIEAILFE